MNGLGLFHPNDDAFVGIVCKVDNERVGLVAPDERTLRKIRVNGYVWLNTYDPNARLIGRIERVVRIEAEAKDRAEQADSNSERREFAREATIVTNEITVKAVGTLRGAGGGRIRAAFAQAVEALPEIGARCYFLTGPQFATFAALLANQAVNGSASLMIGSFAQAPDAPALLDGNALFGRHAAIVGSTGAGKSWAAASLIEQAADLPHANMLVFDVHGEYAPLARHANIARLRIAGPGDLERPGEDALFLPYWLLGYEEMLALMPELSEEQAPNQAAAFSGAVFRAKRAMLEKAGMAEDAATFTIDSPIPYDLDQVVGELEEKNRERVVNPRTGKEHNGPEYGKFDRFLLRLKARRADRRLGFLFRPGAEQMRMDYLETLAVRLMRPGGDGSAGVKIIDMSEVPSDILPVIVGLLAGFVFKIQQWSAPEARHPVALVCDEAHLYLPERHAADAAERRALAHFERIAKEGRKYGVTLLVVSQRPCELNAAVMSQIGNVIAFRLSAAPDKAAVAHYLPDASDAIVDMLPVLGPGEAIVVGAAFPLPARIRIREPILKPGSESPPFWNMWRQGESRQNLPDAVRNWRRQKSIDSTPGNSVPGNSAPGDPSPGA